MNVEESERVSERVQIAPKTCSVVFEVGVLSSRVCTPCVSFMKRDGGLRIINGWRGLMDTTWTSSEDRF